jgi:hypothetical protein
MWDEVFGVGSSGVKLDRVESDEVGSEVGSNGVCSDEVGSDGFKSDEICSYWEIFWGLFRLLQIGSFQLR